MNTTKQGPGASDKKDSGKAKPAAELAGKSLTEQRRGKGSYTLGKYLGYLSALRYYYREWDNPRAERSAPPEEPSRGGVLDAIERCDKTDPEVRRQLVKIADRAEDEDIKVAAMKATLLEVGSVLTGIRPSTEGRMDAKTALETIRKYDPHGTGVPEVSASQVINAMRHVDNTDPEAQRILLRIAVRSDIQMVRSAATNALPSEMRGQVYSTC